jgi:hypothetical protein
VVSREVKLKNKFLTRKSSGGHQAKKKRRKKPKPEEQEGMPQHQHCPPEVILDPFTQAISETQECGLDDRENKK